MPRPQLPVIVDRVPDLKQKLFRRYKSRNKIFIRSLDGYLSKTFPTFIHINVMPLRIQLLLFSIYLVLFSFILFFVLFSFGLDRRSRSEQSNARWNVTRDNNGKFRET